MSTTTTSSKPRDLQAQLNDLAVALHASVNDHPLLKLGDKACQYMVTLIKKDPVHEIDDKEYREFYRVVQDIVKSFEDLENPPSSHVSCLDRYRLRRLKIKLKSEYKTASTPRVCHWEDAMIITGGIVSTISAAPGLALLKPIGSVLSEIGQLVKTTRSNKAEYEALLRLATAILEDLTRKMEMGGVKLTEDMEHSVTNFKRILVRIHDSLTELGRVSRSKHVKRLVFADNNKEELADLRRELESAQMVFMTSNVWAARLEVQAVQLEFQAVISARALEVQRSHHTDYIKLMSPFFLN